MLPVVLYGCETWSLSSRKDAGKQDPKMNIWAQEEIEWGVEKTSQ